MDKKTTNWTRRDFLRTSAAAAAGLQAKIDPAQLVKTVAKGVGIANQHTLPAGMDGEHVGYFIDAVKDSHNRMCSVDFVLHGLQRLDDSSIREINSNRAEGNCAHYHRKKSQAKK